MNWLLIALKILPPFVRDAAWYARFKAWEDDYEKKLAADELKNRPAGPGPLGPVVVLLILVLAFSHACGPKTIRTINNMRVYCCDPVLGHPEECLALPVELRPVCPSLPAPTAVATVVPTVVPPTPSATPTASPSPVATAAPTAIPTLAPPPVPTPQEGCLVRSSVPPEAMRVLTSGGCRPPFRRIDDPVSGAHGCVIYWHCADGNDAFNCPTRVSADLHFQNLTLGDPDGFIHNGEHPRVDAYCRRLRDDGGIIHAGLEPDGYQPEDWESATICRPVLCEATPAPTMPPPPVITPAPPVGGSCHLPAGAGDGQGCPRTSPRLLDLVSTALDAVTAAHEGWFEAPGVVLAGRELDFYAAVVAQLRAEGACAFLDPSGTELGLKTSNDFSEQYAVLSSSRNVRRGENSYRATCTPAWSAIPAAEANAAPPLNVLQKVGDHCQNPESGPRFQKRHECVVDSTAVFRNPETPGDNQHDQPCDPDHEPAWSTFCHQNRWLDPRGPARTVNGAVSWYVDEENPSFTVVVFEPGQAFRVCTRPQDQSVTPVIGPAEQCKEQTH